MNVSRLRELISGLAGESEVKHEFHRSVGRTLQGYEAGEDEPSFDAMTTAVDDAVARGPERAAMMTDDTVAPDHGDLGIGAETGGVPDLLKSSFGRYEPLKTLGSGGMGEVCRVLDRSLGRVVAMKTIHRGMLGSDGAVLRFLQEAQVLAQLDHPHIGAMYDVGILSTGQLYFTMSEIQGQSLHQHIRQVHQVAMSDWSEETEEGWTLWLLVRAFLDVCNAVAYAHDRGVIHRDLKPANVMVGSFGEVRVVDWGLAKVMSAVEPPGVSAVGPVATVRSGSASHNTMAGVVTGTPAYMAPEQAAGRASASDRRTDVYSLAVILYEILRGRPPFEGSSFAEIMARVVNGDSVPFGRPFDQDGASPAQARGASPPFVSCGGLEIPEVLAEVSLRGMALRPEDRYQSADDLARAIRAWLDGTKGPKGAANGDD